jgi:hypothetical protein
MSERISESDRQACKSVLRSYNEARAVEGSAPAIDYSTFSGGRGSQYSSYSTVTIIDFLVDVEHVLFQTLQQNEITLFLRTILDPDRTVSSRQIQKLESKLGRVFKTRQIWPVAGYLRTIRRALPRDRI